MKYTICAALAISLQLSAQTSRWPQYRGPDGSGISETAAATEFGPKQNVRWTAALPRGHSSPAIWDNHLFVTGFDESAKKLELVAIDRQSGKIRWRETVPSTQIEQVHAVSSPASATPVVDGERVYVYFGSAGLFCYDFEGKLVWSKPMPAAQVSFGSGTSPLLLGEAIVLAQDYGERRMFALERKSGRALWDVKLEGTGTFAGHASPVAWKNQIVLHRPSEVAGYDAASGSRLWWTRVVSQGTGTPVIHGDLLFVGAWGNEADLRDPVPDWKGLVEKFDKDGDGLVSRDEFPDDLAFSRRVDGDKTTGAIVTFKRFFGSLDGDKNGKVSQAEWEGVLKWVLSPAEAPHGLLAIRLGGKQDVTGTNVAWSEERAVPEVPVPLAYRGQVYAVTNGGIVSALDEKSGKLIYRGRLGAGGMYYASPVAAGGNVYFASGDGVVSVIRSGEKLEVIARNDLGEPIFATPAIVDGRLYVRTAGHLYAFQK